MLYRNAILGFGLALPLVICGVLIGAGLYARGEIQASLATKKASFSTFEINRKAGLALEGQIGRKRPEFQRWLLLVSKDTSTAFSENVRAITESISPEHFAQSTFEPSKSMTGFSQASAQASSQLKMVTRGTYWATQNVLLNLEARMPQLQLQELKIDSNSSSTSSLNFQFSFAAWEK